MANAMREPPRAVRPVWILTVLLFVAGCAASGAQQFQAGHAAYAGGDLAEAYKQYTAAVTADPANASFKAAKTKIAGELAEKSATEAAGLEEQGQWSDASVAWAEAAELVADETSYAARRDLATARAGDPDEVKWFEAAKGVADRYPGDAYAEQTLSTARETAYRYQLGLGEDLLAAGRGTEALKNFESAKAIDPDAPGLRVDLMTKAEALALSEEGDALAKDGEHIAAYEKYQAAYAKLALPEIKTKRAQSKVKAGRILAMLEQARSQSKRGRLSQSLALYEKALKMGGVPASVQEEVDQTRGALVKQDAARATRYAGKGDLRRAQRTIEVGLRHAKADKAISDKVKAGLKAARGYRPAEALDAFDNAGLPENSPLYDASLSVALASAKVVYARARRYRKSNKAKALGLLADLEPFEDDLPQVAQLRRSLRAGSFLALLDEAQRAAKRKRDGEAASLLMAALNASEGKDVIRAQVTEGTDALKVGRFAGAEGAFRDALAAAPRSKLAQTAIALTRSRRLQAEAEAVALLKTGKGNDLAATDVLEAGLRLDPSNATAKAGAKALMARLSKKGLTDAQAGSLIGYANRLGVTPGAAQSEVATGAQRLAEGDLTGAGAAFSAALDAAPGAELAKLGQAMANTRALASLKGEARAATTGDTAAAEALAELLEKNPNDRDARRQLQALLDKAKSFAATQNDAEAARFIGLATIAQRPGPQLKVALDKGTAALKVGNLVAAEKAYAEAVSIDANSAAGRTGYAIAKEARVSALKSALSAAQSGGDLKAVETQLKATMAAAPTSDEGKVAFDTLVTEAHTQAAAGQVARAAQLLDAATVAEPASRRSALKAAQRHLQSGDFAQADAAYSQILQSGSSAVAAAGQKIARSGASTTLATAVKGLETGNDLVRGAAAARSLLRADANNAAARAAVRAGLQRAQDAAGRGDDAGAARNLQAVATALGTPAAMRPAIDLLARGKYAEAEAAFGKDATSEVGRTGASIARSRKLFSLKAGLSGAGTSAALSIRRLLQADPNSPEAKKAFAGMLTKATTAARTGDDKKAADVLNQASVAAASPRALDQAIRNATAQLKEGRYALSELAFRAARDVNADSAVVKAGLEIAGSSRKRFEQEKLRAFASSGDPRPHATGLFASLKVDPKSPAVTKGLAALLARADRSAKKANDTDAAQSLEAAAVLENKSAEQVQTISEASVELGKGAFSEARKGFALANADQERSAMSKVADAGARIARSRQLTELKKQFAAAGKSKDILQQADIVQRILEVEPRDRMALTAKRKLVVSVQRERLAAARTQKAQGKLGLAHLYLVRSLALNEKDRAAQAELKDVEAKLQKSSALIMVVEPVQRDTRLGTRPCSGFDAILRETLQSELSEQANLGAYVLSPAWTKLYEKKDTRAPVVNGGLRVRLDKCRVDSGSGEVSYTWDILSPRRGGEVAKGSFKTTLPKGLVLREEQDAAGVNASKKLAKRLASDLIERLEEERSEINAWLVSRAEYGMKIDDPVMVAEAYGRIRQKNPRSLDPDRIIPIEAYLAKNFR